MASVQARRENVTEEGSIAVQKDRVVPKMAIHFESLAVKAGVDPQHVPGAGETENKRDERHSEAGKRLNGGGDGGQKAKVAEDVAVTGGAGAAAVKNQEERKVSHENLGNVEEITLGEWKEQVEATPGKLPEIIDKEAPEKGQEWEAGGSILQAIGETIVEIGQTTKALLMGQDPIRVFQHKDRQDSG